MVFVTIKILFVNPIRKNKNLKLRLCRNFFLFSSDFFVIQLDSKKIVISVTYYQKTPRNQTPKKQKDGSYIKQ